jgi:hypothetical protein
VAGRVLDERPLTPPRAAVQKRDSAAAIPHLSPHPSPKTALKNLQIADFRFLSGEFAEISL